jgi:3-oxoacyl-[acyl-carrier-protein] synthase III
MGAKITAISYYLPEKIITNAAFFADFPDYSNSALDKLGIEERRRVGNGETASDLALKAGQKLMQEYNIDPSSIDFLLLGILEPDYYTPPTSCVLHGKLGLPKNCGTLEFNHGCSAYVYGLATAQGLMSSLGVRRVLFLATSVLSNTFHREDRSSNFVFGDGASATLIEYSETEHLGPYEFGTDGSGYNKIIVEDGHARNPINARSNEEVRDQHGNVTTRAHFRMDGVGVFLFSVRTVPEMIFKLLEKSGHTMEDIDHFVFHQPNRFLNETLRKKTGIPEAKFRHDIAKTGNTVQSTIPIALKHMLEEGKIKSGDKIVLAGFGVGLSWMSTVVRF